MIITIIITIISLSLIFEINIILTYSGFISKKDEKFYSNLTEYKLNIYNDKLLCVYILNKKITFIAPIKSVFFKYYINGVGVVPKYSKLHKKIKEYYKKAKENEKYN